MDEDTIVSLGVIAAILVVSAGLINIWINRTEEKGVLALYILNSNGNADPRFYPTNVTAGEGFLLYISVQNDGEETLHLRVEVKIGNTTTPPPNRTTPSPLPPLKSLEFTVSPRSLSTSPLELALNETGLNRRIIFELYAYDAASGNLRYTGLWDQLWVNVTEPPS
jgi:uncharacterized membrane protein